MKFKVGDRVVIKKGSDEHGIPEGTVCEIESVRGPGSGGDEFPYVIRRMKSVVEDDAMAEDEIELVEG